MRRFLSIFSVPLLSLLVSAPASAERAPRVRPLKIPGGIVQITGKQLRVGQSTFKKRGPADPFVDIRPDGKVHVYGTVTSVPRNGKHSYLEFPSVESFLTGGKYTTKPLDLQPGLTGKEQAWDFLPHRWDGGQEVLYAGVMTPTARRTKHARWPDDNWTRRIYAFTRGSGGKWVMNPRAVFNPVTPETKPSMQGHTYGHQFKEIERQTATGVEKETWLFHEEISGTIETPDGPRLKTEIFARKMLSPFKASEEKVRIFGVGSPARYGKRVSGEHVVEGPRPFEATIRGERIHFVSLSGSDFFGDNYDVNIVYRRGDGIGEYQPILGVGGELKQQAEKLKAKYGLSWVGRAHMIEHKGQHYAVFHGVDKRVHPDADYSGKTAPDKLSQFHRNIYVVPMKFDLDTHGVPVITLVDDPTNPA